MKVWVLPNVLEASLINRLSDEILELFTRVSTGIVSYGVNAFIDKYLESSDEELRTAANKLKTAYEHVNTIENYLNSDEAKNLADELASLQYSDVSPELGLDTLKHYRYIIIELLSEDKDFVESYDGEIPDFKTSGMKTAYTTKLGKDNLNDIMDKIMEAAKESEDFMAGVQLCNIIRNNKNLFKNGIHNENKSTVLRKAIYKKDKLRTILKGLDFLIPRLESGQSPVSWRRL